VNADNIKLKARGTMFSPFNESPKIVLCLQ